MPTISEQTLAKLRQLSASAQGADQDQLQQIRQAMALTRANRTIASQIESLSPGEGESILGETGRTALNAIGKVGHFLDTPGRELVRRPVTKALEYFGAVPEGTSKSETMTTAEILRAAGMPDAWYTSALGVVGDITTDPLIYLKAPGALSKLAARYGSIADVPLTKTGAKALGARVAEIQKAQNTTFTEASSRAVKEFTEAARSNTISPKFLERGGIKVGIPFTGIEKTLLPEASFKRAASVIRSQVNQNEILSQIAKPFDYAYATLKDKFKDKFKVKGVFDRASQVALEQHDQTLNLSRVATNEFMKNTVAPIWNTGWMKGKENKATFGAIRDAIENLRDMKQVDMSGLPAWKSAVIPDKIRGMERTLAKAGSDPVKIAEVYDAMIANPSGKMAALFKEKLVGTKLDNPEGFEAAVTVAKQWQVAMSEKWNALVTEFGKDAAPKWIEAYMPLVLKLGPQRARELGGREAMNVTELVKTGMKEERQFRSYQDVFNYVQKVAKERGITDVDRMLKIVDDPIHTTTAYLLAADNAIANKRLMDTWTEMAKREVVQGRGALAEFGFKLKSEAPNPHEGITELTDEMRTKYLGGRGGGKKYSDAQGMEQVAEGKFVSTAMRPKGLDTIELNGKEFIGREEIIGKLRELEMLDQRGKFRSEVVGMLQNITNNFKRGVTQGFASFHIRNLYSDLGRQLEDDLVGTLNPNKQLQAVLIQAGKKGEFTTREGARISFDEIRQMFKENLAGFHVQRGDYTQSFINEMRQTKGNVRHLASKYMAFMERSGVHVENHSKLMGFLNALDRGLPIEDAASRVYRTHFNYSWVTSFDKQVKTLVPFYIWQKKSAQHILTQLIERPGTQSTILRGLQALETELPRAIGVQPLTEEQRGALPEFLQEGPVIPFWSDFEVSGDVGLASGLDITQGELSKLALFNAPSWPDLKRQLQQFASLMNPAVKIPAELLSGQDFFFGTPIDDLSRTTAEGAKKYQYRGKVTYPFTDKHIAALEDPVSRRFIEAAGLLVSAIPGMSWTAALGRIISEKRRIEDFATAAASTDAARTFAAGANLFAGVRARTYNPRNLTIQKEAGGASAQNERLRQVLYNLRRTAGTDGK